MLTNGFGDIAVLFGDFLVSRSYGAPESIVHDPQVRDVRHHPVRLRVQARHTPAGGRIFDIAEAIPDQSSDVEFVVDNTGSTLYVPPDRRIIPRLPVRPANPFLVQVSGDCARGLARSKLAEYPPD